MSWRNWFNFNKPATRPTARRQRFVPSVEMLESRWVPSTTDLGSGAVAAHGLACGCPFCGGTFAPAVVQNAEPVTNTTSGVAGALAAIADVPQLSSLPGAPATIYLNFIGSNSPTWWGWSEPANGVSVYSTDSDLTTFSSSELADIQRTWAAVAEDYAPFNINVTTVAPASTVRRVSQIDIGQINSPWGGLGQVGGLSTSTGANPVHGWSRYAIGSIVSHEAGHNMGLQHQSQYSANGSRVSEYYAGETNAVPIMGNGYNNFSTWWYGTSTSASTYQNDAAVITRTANGFGFRADEAGDTQATAKATTLAGSSVTGSGIIGPSGDIDFWSINAGAGNLSVSVTVPLDNNLDVRLELRSASGTLIASAAPTNSYGATINATVASGTYYLVVSGEDYRASAGDVSYPLIMGQYTISGTAAPAVPDTTAPQASLASAGNVTVAGAATYPFQVNYTDNVGIDLASLGNADIRVTGPNGFSQLATYVGITGNTATYQINTPGGAWDSDDSGAYTIQLLANQVRDTSGNFVAARSLGTFQVNIVPTLTTPVLALTGVSDTSATLTWTDSNIETGYDIYRDGALVSSLAANTTSTVVTGLFGGNAYRLMVQARTSTQVANSNTVIANTTANTLVAPTQLGPIGSITAAAGFDRPTFTWSNVPAAHHYYLYVVDLTTGQAAFTDPHVVGTSFTPTAPLTPGHTYTWYLGANNADGSINRFAPAGQTFTLANLAAPTLAGPTGFIAAGTGFDQPTFTWNASAGAHHYYLYVVDTTTNKAVIDLPNVSGLSHTGTALTPGHSFVWYVGAISTDGKVNSHQATGRAFTLGNLAVPTLSGPSGFIPASAGYDRPTFAWSASAGADHYYLYVIDTTTNKAVLDLPNLTGLSYRPGAAQGLTPGHSFVWYVGAISKDGKVNSHQPAGRTFTLAALTAPTQIGPIGRITTTTPTFSWTAVTGADHYHLFVVDVTDPLLAVAPIDLTRLTSTSYTPTTPLRAGRNYVWYLSAVSANNLEEVYLQSGVTFSIA